MTIDWDEAVRKLKDDVEKHGGFLSLQKDELRERFGIGRFYEPNSNRVVDALRAKSLLVFPQPYGMEGSTLRVYDLESEIGGIARAILFPESTMETELVDAVTVLERAAAGKRLDSVLVPWLTALDVLLHVAIRKLPVEWEYLRHDLETFEVIMVLVEELGLPSRIQHDEGATRQLAGFVCGCRPVSFRSGNAPPGLDAVRAEVARGQKVIFDKVIREAATWLLRGAEIPSDQVDLGKLGFRYRCEDQEEHKEAD